MSEHSAGEASVTPPRVYCGWGGWAAEVKDGKCVECNGDVSKHRALTDEKCGAFAPCGGWGRTKDGFPHGSVNGHGHECELDVGHAGDHACRPCTNEELARHV